jgi:hypothetical protein
MGICLDDFGKVEFSGTIRPASIPDDQRVTAIFKVMEAHYVPKKVQLRARMDSEMFTGSFIAADLKEINADAKVISIAISRPLDLIE